MSRNQNNLIRFLIISFAGLLAAGYVLVPSPITAEKGMFTGNEQHQITTETALRYVSNYHTMSGEQLTAGYMGRNIFAKILTQEEAVGVRIYNARLDDGRPTYVVVGVDSDGNDLLAGVIGEDIIPCPPRCGKMLWESQPIALR